jgi:YggT family protein
MIVDIALKLAFSLYILLFIFRIVLTWFPKNDLNKLPWNLIAWPTEPFLKPLRKLIPTFGGIDMTPFACLAITSLLQELLVGQQGLIAMLTRLQ